MGYVTKIVKYYKAIGTGTIAELLTLGSDHILGTVSSYLPAMTVC